MSDIQSAEQLERQHLEHVKQRLQHVLEEINSKVARYAKEIREQKEYLWENKTGMDHVEKISVRQSVDQFVSTADAVQDKGKRIRKLLASPYFGRFDFQASDAKDVRQVYVGVYAFFDEVDQKNLIHDWRAPISTMFYDYETGPAQFVAPDGVVHGSIHLKRQYRIRKGQMDFMLESDLNIHDDVLQKELSLASDDKMKNIVATIQRDQNAIIRNEASDVLIIQGVAGSGKTSIALHRIAFLLYRFKDSIRSSDILIISPNKVFADFISNVLPELGEETIPEMGIEQLATELLQREFKFQTFYEQVSYLLDKNDPGFRDRIKFKASFDFLGQLDRYLDYADENYFKSHDLSINGKLVPEWFMAEKFAAYKHMPIVRRLAKIARDIETNVGIYYHHDVTPKERSEIKAAVRKMFRFSTLRSLYKDFYAWLECPSMCRFQRDGSLEYSDVFPLIYMKMRWDGIQPFGDVKHLLVDEMQDYTPVQYAVLSRLFDCKKTILGDANQSVNPFSSSSASGIRQVFTEADCVQLNKSYRSTYEITDFAQQISSNQDLEVIERHGERPQVVPHADEEQEIEYIRRLALDFPTSGYHSLGIICRTQEQARALQQRIKSLDCKAYLISATSESFIQGIIVCTAHMSKGLEFDHVIVPQVTDKNYHSEIDRSMLYVACTRAMHRLTLTHTGRPSPLLPELSIN